MPMYEYKCECGNAFEDLNRIAERHQAECLLCGRMAKVIMSAPRIDPNADLPGQRMKWRKGAERRGRGADMTAANRTVADESVERNAHARRAARNENPIISS